METSKLFIDLESTPYHSYGFRDMRRVVTNPATVEQVKQINNAAMQCAITAKQLDCQVCGEDHEGNVPYACESGDGI